MMGNGSILRQHIARMDGGKPCDEHELKQILCDFFREDLCARTSEDAIEVVNVLRMDFLKRPPKVKAIEVDTKIEVATKTTLVTIQEQARFAMSSERQTKKDKASTSDKLDSFDMRQHMNHQAFMAHIEERWEKGEDSTTFVGTSDQAEKQPLANR